MEAKPGDKKRRRSASAAGLVTTKALNNEKKSSVEGGRLKHGLISASLLGMVKVKTPSLVVIEPEETRLATSARAIIDRFLRRWIAKRRGTVVRNSITKKQQSKANCNFGTFSWLPQLISSKHSPGLRNLATYFLVDTMRTKRNTADIVEQACLLLSRSPDPTCCVPLVEGLKSLLARHPPLLKKALQLGVVRSCQDKIYKLVTEMVDAEMHLRQPRRELMIALKPIIELAGLFVNQSEMRPECAMDLQLLRAVALLQSLELGTVLGEECMILLKSLYDTLEKGPEPLVKEAGKALDEFVPKLSRSYRSCFMQCKAIAAILDMIINVIVPKHKIPDVSIQLQRAATQEEYFRSGLTRSTITLNDIPRSSKDASQNSPTVSDLKLKIATDLGMSSSLEMFELVCANKILGPDLELTKVFDQIWRPHVAARSKTLVSAIRRQSGAIGLSSGEGGARRGGSNSGVPASSSNPRMIDISSSLGDILYRSITSRHGELELVGDDEPALLAAREAVFVEDMEDDEEIDDDEEIFEDDEDEEVPQALLRHINNAAAFQLGRLVGVDEDDEEIEVEEEEDSEMDEEGEGAPVGEEDESDHVVVSMPFELDLNGGESSSNVVRAAPATTSTSTSNNKAAPAVTMIPAMTITYRLCAVDGEATEDFVSSLPSSSQDAKKEYFSATTEYGEHGLRALVTLVSVCVDNLKVWPFPVAKSILTLTLNALDQAVSFNGPTLLRLGALPVLLRTLVDSGGDSISNLCLGILDKLVSGPSDELEEGAFTTTTYTSSPEVVGGDQLDWVLERLDSFSNKPKLVNALARLVPHLIYGRVDKAKQLALELENKRAKPWTLSVIENLSSAPDTILLRDALFELGTPQKCVDQIKKSTTESFLEHAALPDTQLSLRMLKGLVKGHLPSAQLVCESPCLSILVRMEEVSSTKVESVGAHAFAVLEALSSPTSHPQIRDAVARIQKQRKEELRLMASKKRNKAVKLLAKQQQAGANTTSMPSSSSSMSKKQKRWMDELSALEEEDSNLVCIVCHEGYKSKPNQLMCVYTFEKSAQLPQGSTFITSSGNVKRTGGAGGQNYYSLVTSSSFVCIHQSCHESAARTDRSHPKAPKDEWEGAELRNGHVRCNNLIPLRGTAVKPVYDTAVHTYFERADRDTKIKISSASFSSDPSAVSLVLHDLRILLLRIAFGESLTEDTRGGSIESNLKLIVPLMHMIRSLFQTSSQCKTAAETLLALHLGDPSQCDVAFASILSLFFFDLSKWEETRVENFLKQLPSHVATLNASFLAGDQASIGSGALAPSSSSMSSSSAISAVVSSSSQQSSAPVVGRNRSRSRARSVSAVGAELEMNFAVVDDNLPKPIRPWLCFFGMVDEIHRTQKQDMTDHDALEAASRLAENTRIMLNSCASLNAMAKHLRISPEELRVTLATAPARSRSASLVSTKEGGTLDM